MSKGLEELKDLKNAFIGHCRELKCEENYIKVCENKFGKTEKELKAYKELQKEYLVLSIKEKALDILIKWYQPDIIHDLCCFGASDEEIALVKEILNEHR